MCIHPTQCSNTGRVYRRHNVQPTRYMVRRVTRRRVWEGSTRGIFPLPLSLTIVHLERQREITTRTLRRCFLRAQMVRQILNNNLVVPLSTAVRHLPCHNVSMHRIYRPTTKLLLQRTTCNGGIYIVCLLYTSPSPRDRQKSRMPSSA